MRSLLLDTAGRHALIALAEGDQVRQSLVLPNRKALSEDLVPAIQELIDDAGLSPANLTGAVAATGPGSFTGVRMGLAAVAGLALPLGWAVVGVDRFNLLLQSMIALGRCPESGNALLLLDSGRTEPFGLSVPLDGFVGNAVPTIDLQAAQVLDAPALQDAMSAAACIAVEPGSTDGFIDELTKRVDSSAPEIPLIRIGEIPWFDALAKLGGVSSPEPTGQVPVPLYLRAADASPAPEPRGLK